ncbi:MAG: DUF692 family protein [Clostridia bacterium]
MTKKIHLVINDLEETRLLVKENKIQVDFSKYPSLAAPSISIMQGIQTKILYHGLVGFHGIPDILSASFINELDLKQTAELIKYSNTPTLSIHLGDNIDNVSQDEMLNILQKNVKFVQDMLVTDNIRYISLENMELNSPKECVDPLFISNAIKVTSCNLLLDTAHATISANTLGMTVYEYLDLLPLDKVKEVHFSGTKHADGKIYSHIRARKHDYELLEYVLKRTTPEFLTLEYGTPKYKLRVNPNRTKFSLSLPRVAYAEINESAIQELLSQYNYILNLLNKLGYTRY